MKRLCVFAGSNLGSAPEFANMAEELGKSIADKGLELVYGGSNIGLMGKVANAVLQNGGKATGVMPSGLFGKEVVHRGLTELIEVKDMHERKAKMNELADGFIALPGGYGTFEELFEAVSWAQIGLHHKPVGVLNTAGYYDPLLSMIGRAVEAGFMPKTHAEYIIAERNPTDLLNRFISYIPTKKESKWLSN
jgi:hypothetical protein